MYGISFIMYKVAEGRRSSVGIREKKKIEPFQASCWSTREMILLRECCYVHRGVGDLRLSLVVDIHNAYD